jgi:hypothetical protein
VGVEAVVGSAVEEEVVVVLGEVVEEDSNRIRNLVLLRHHDLARPESTRINSMFILPKRILIAKTRP